MKKILILIVKAVVQYAVSAGMVALGWNVILTMVFENIPRLNVEQILLLTLALPFIFYPVTRAISESVKRELLEKSLEQL